MAWVICKKCGTENDYREEKSGPHIKAICNACDAYIKFLPQGFTDETVMFYGKYKGRMLKDVPPDYLIWMYDNDKTNGSLRLYIKANLQKLKSKINESR